METFFDQVAPRWDALRRSLFDDSLRDQILALGQVTAGGPALDVGSGTGFLAEGLVRAGARTHAIDASAGMVAELGRKFGTRIDVRQGDGLAIPYPDHSFATVVANMYLHHAEDPALAIREMARVLAPGGRLAFADMDRHGFEWLREEHHDRWMGFERDDVRRWLRAAGLADIVVDCAAGSCCASNAAGPAQATVSVFLASATKPA